MFTTEQIIGDIVFISFKEVDRYKDLGINQESGHFMIMGYDNLGMNRLNVIKDRL